MRVPSSWSGVAWNPVPHSENRIHGDEGARRHGFEGGLVPGVVVSACLMHPAVAAWGRDWLERGRAEAVVQRPVYDGEAFDVQVADADARRYRAALVGPGGTPRATAEVALPDAPPDPPVRRGDPVLRRGHARLPASRETFERLRERGFGAVRARWPEAEITSYLADPAALPAVLRPDGEGLASPAFFLGVTNWALAANVHLTAWLHLQTGHQSFAAIPPGTELVVELAVADLFEKKGHEFVDVDVAAFRSDDDAAVMRCRLRAIHRLRGAGAE